MGMNRMKLLQLAVIFTLMFIFYLIIYESSVVHSLVKKYILPKKSRQLSLNQFRQLLAKNQNLNITSILSFHTKSSLCPIIPPNLVGSIKINTDILSYKQIEDRNPDLEPGGHYSPKSCSPRHHVAIIVPYRDRQSHLKVFLQNIHPFLQKQQIDYGLFVIELVSGVTFNRAMLFNIGFVESLKMYNYTCFIFHDVDLVPENDLNLYTCGEKPRHMSVAINTMHYKLPYHQIFGGASAMTKEQFETVNGFSNSYFGWGGEDDDMYNRISYNKMNIIRYSATVARYKMLSHSKDSPNPVRFKLLQYGKERYKTDGLNSLKYDVLKIEKRKLFTWILVKIDDSVTLDLSTYTGSKVKT